MSNLPIFPTTIKSWLAKIALADTTALKTLVTPGANGSRIDSIMVSNTATAAASDLQFYITFGGVDYLIDTVTIPVNSGFVNSIVPVAILAHATKFLWTAYDANGNRYLVLASGAVLKAKVLANMATGKEIAIFAQGADY